MTSKPRLSNRAARRRVDCQSGQSLMEFAIILPLLLVLLAGVIEIGRYTYASILVGNAARAGAAFGAQDHFTAGNPNGIIAAAQNDFQNNGQPLANLNVTSSWVCSCDNAGTMGTVDCVSGICPTGTNKVVSLQVTAHGTFTSLFSFPGLPSTLNVTRSAILRIGT